MKKKKIGVGSVAILIVFLVIASTISISSSAHADAANDLITKVLYRGLSLCYSDTYTKKTIPEADLGGASSLMTSKGKDDGTIKVPTGVGNTLSDGDISCEQLFNGYNGLGGKIQGLVARTGKSVSKSTVTQMGYHEQSSSGGEGKGCVSLSYKYTKQTSTGAYQMINSPESTNQYCFKLDDDDKIIEVINDSSMQFSSPIYLISNGSDQIQISGKGFEYYQPSASWYYGKSWSEFEKSFNDAAKGVNGVRMCDATYDESCLSQTYEFSGTSTGKVSGGAKEYEKDTTDAATKALRYFTGNPNAKFDDYKYTVTDAYNLGSEYVKQNSNSLVISSASECTTDLAKAKEKTGYALRDGDKWCPVDGVGNVGGSFNMIDSSLTSLQSKDFAGVVTSLMSLNYNKLAEEGTEAGPIGGGGVTETPGGGLDPTESGNPENTETPICTQVSGVLTWVLCPVLSFVGDTAGDVYQWIADNFIEIDANTLFQRNEGVYEGWSNFRNFANVLFAVLFAIVILAQITGIGISNYNVKKILPRLIITVVLVNVSFILCQLAVDLSNIVGKSINDLLEGFAGGNPFNFAEIGGLTNELVSGSESGLGSKIQGVASIMTIGALGVLTWRLWLPMLFLSLISALVGVLFFFLILGIRQAGVIIAVVIAPVAIVCYSLPNTKTLFDKWWKIFSALLMVYPICGAMMGGGTYAATLMVQANKGDFLYFIIAMLLKIVPFFFVPSILKNSLNGIGMLGAKLNGLSKTAQGRASGAVGRSQRFQDFDRRMKVGRANAAMKRHEFLANTRAGKALGKASESLNNYSKKVAADIAANKKVTVADRILGGIAGAAAAPRNANRRQYDRNARTVLAGEREQAMADNLNLDAIRSGESRRQFEMDKANEDALYRDSIQYTDDAAVAKEYKTALDDFLVDPNDNRKRARVAALQDRLSRTDDGAAFMMSTLTETAADKSMAGDTAALKSLQTAAGYIDADGLKKKNRNFYKTAQDFANGNFSMADDRSKLGSYEVEVSDGHGGKTKRNVFFASKYNNTRGGIKYSASSFAGLDDSAFKQILQGVESGEIDGENLQTIMDVANDALTGAANGTITMDAGAIDHARKITSAGYARSAVTATKPGATAGAAPITVRTEGSQAIARAGAQSINKLVQDVQAGSSALSDKDAVSIAQNMQTAINDDTNMFENSQIEGMRQFVTAVNQRIASDPSLGTKFDLKQFESGSVKIRGAQKPQKLTTPTIPTNWKQVPDITAATPGTMKWVETNSAGLSVRDLNPDEIQHIADVQEAQKIVRQENVKRGFGPTRPGSPTP